MEGKESLGYLGFATEIPDTLTMLNSAFSSLAARAARRAELEAAAAGKQEGETA